VQRGTHEELLESGGLYRALYDTQFASQASTHRVGSAVDVDYRRGGPTQQG
jgi:hypothetical protein